MTSLCFWRKGKHALMGEATKKEEKFIYEDGKGKYKVSSYGVHGSKLPWYIVSRENSQQVIQWYKYCAKNIKSFNKLNLEEVVRSFSIRSHSHHKAYH
jgi:hypothetical protein